MDACAQKRLNCALKECFNYYSIVASRASLCLRVVFLFTVSRNPHFALRRKKNLCADGDFCVVKKAGKEISGAREMRLKRADSRDNVFLSLECRASKRWSRSEDCSRRDCRLRSSRAVFRTSLSRLSSLAQIFLSTRFNNRT